MCGIAGILHFDKSKPVSELALIAMRDSMAHRGPDGVGCYVNGEIGLAHRRLSIIDLSERGHQPFFTPDKRYAIVFNGEIFNYKELRQELLADGIKFNSDSDTEVLLHLYVKLGSAVLEKLNGMFAFAIWDTVERSLFVARDRVGIKPLYYSLFDRSLYFASEPKALLTAGVSSELNQEAMSELLLYKYVAGEQTVFKHVQRLLPGHFMIVREDTVKKVRWWNLAEKVKANREALPRNPYTWFEEIFYSSVKYRTISDVPVGVMLSGGLDSGSVAAALHNNGEVNLAAFTFVFDDPLYNEGPLAQKVADKFGLQLHTVELKEQTLMHALREAAWLYDEPLVHQNDAQMLALSKEAKKYVTVLLSGEGGDEFMGGYVRYKPLNHYRLLKFAAWSSSILKYTNQSGIVNRFDKLNRYLKDSRLSSLVLLNASSVYPDDLTRFGQKVDVQSFSYRNQVLAEAIDLYPHEPARQAMYMDLFTHMSSVLDRNDRMTMGAGIECRVPFMDYRLMEMIPALPSDYLLRGKKGKFLLVNSVAKHLPREVLQFKKLGFSVPWEKYMKEDEEFKEYIHQMEKGQHTEMFKGLNTKTLFNDFNKGNTLASALVRQLFMVSIWKERYVNVFKKSPLLA